MLFGAATIWAGGRTLFGPGSTAAGDYVPFVLWFNFLAGFFYIAAGVGLWLGRRWGCVLAVALAVLTALVFAAFGAHILSGGAFEMRTVAAMSLRTVVWFTIAVLALLAWKRA